VFLEEKILISHHFVGSRAISATTLLSKKSKKSVILGEKQRPKHVGKLLNVKRHCSILITNCKSTFSLIKTTKNDRWFQNSKLQLLGKITHVQRLNYIVRYRGPKQAIYLAADLDVLRRYVQTPYWLMQILTATNQQTILTLAARISRI